MNRLRECRENVHLSQKYVAVTLHVAPPSVANWESGKTRPTHENLVKLADLYNVSVDYLIGRANIPEIKMDEINEIDFALNGAIRELSDNEKQDLLDYVHFKQAQKNRRK